jgi:AcrR family transcriptional regulator
MSRSTLTRDQIIDSAIGLLDEDGLDGLNMRALGNRLGFAATAVYWHVGSKDDLVNLAVDSAWHEIALPDPVAIGWRHAARAMAVELHSMLTRHPWVLHTFGSYLTYGHGKARYDDANMAIYEMAGFAGPQVDQAITTVYTFVLGHALGAAAPVSLRRRLSRNNADPEQVIRVRMEQARQIAVAFPRLQVRLETPSADYASAPTDSFEFGLAVILDGLASLQRGVTRSRSPR